MSRQRFQTLPGFHIPYSHALVKLGERETNINRAPSPSQGDRRDSAPVQHLLSIRTRGWSQHSPIPTRWDWTGGWSCSRRHSYCDLWVFSSICPKSDTHQHSQHSASLGIKFITGKSFRLKIDQTLGIILGCISAFPDYFSHSWLAKRFSVIPNINSLLLDLAGALRRISTLPVRLHQKAKQRGIPWDG